MSTMITIVTMIILLPLYLFLSMNVILYRRVKRINLGDGNDTVLQRRIRAHGNFAEYAPLGLLLIFILEFNHANSYAVIAAAAFLIIGRISHACALTSVKPQPFLRVFGMVMTLNSLIVSFITALVMVWNR